MDNYKAVKRFLAALVTRSGINKLLAADSGPVIPFIINLFDFQLHHKSIKGSAFNKNCIITR